MNPLPAYQPWEIHRATAVLLLMAHNTPFAAPDPATVLFLVTRRSLDKMDALYPGLMQACDEYVRIRQWEIDAGRAALAAATSEPEVPQLDRTALPDGDYELTDGSAWFSVAGRSIRIQTTDDELMVDIYHEGAETDDPIAWTFTPIDQSPIEHTAYERGLGRYNPGDRH